MPGVCGEAGVERFTVAPCAQAHREGALSRAGHAVPFSDALSRSGCPQVSVPHALVQM